MRETETKKQSPREAIWSWFLGTELPSGKRPRGQAQLYADSRTCRCVLRMDGESRLVIGIWRGFQAEGVGVYYMTKTGRHYYTTNGIDWHYGRYCGMPSGVYGYDYNIESEEPLCRGFVVSVARDMCGYDHKKSSYNVLDIVKHIETVGDATRREQSRKRKLDSITDWANSMPDMPSDFDAWVRAVPFGGEHYMFFDKKKSMFGCSACGATHGEKSKKAKTWRRGQTVNCPSCGVTAKVIRHGTTDTKRKPARIMLVQAHHDRKGKICSVARRFDVNMEWSAGAERYDLWPTHIIVLPLDGGPAHESDVYYRAWDGWSDRNPCMMRTGVGYCYPDLSALDGTVYNHMGLEVAAAKGWCMDWNSLMQTEWGDERIEYLIKGNFKRLVADFAREYSLKNRLKNIPTGKDAKAADILGLDGQGVARLRQHDGGARHLEWLQSCTGCNMRVNRDTGERQLVNERLSDEVWDGLVAAKITPMDCSRMLDRTIGNLSVEQVYRYIEKQAKIYREHIKGGRGGGQYQYYGYSDKEVVVRMWRDTLDMSVRLKLDFGKSMNVRPPDLKARHDELLEIINAERNRMKAEEADRRFPEVAPTCERIRGTYEWGDGTHKVVVPHGVFDIQREGRLLHHCVAANERYIDRIASGESYILFLRRESAPDTPWYTMEVEPGGKIRQLRTTGDSDGADVDREEAKTFLREWSRVVRSRCSREELAAAEVSRIKRLQGFDELRVGGNMIRNGKLAGRLLVEVLEADFRELNKTGNEREEQVS